MLASISSPGGPSESESVEGGVIAPEVRECSRVRGRGEVGFEDDATRSLGVRRGREGCVIGEVVADDGTGFRVIPEAFGCGGELRFGSG